MVPPCIITFSGPVYFLTTNDDPIWNIWPMFVGDDRVVGGCHCVTFSEGSTPYQVKLRTTEKRVLD
jgi:hypothetical protein